MDRKQKKEIVEWGKHELKQGRSLSRLESKLSKEGLPREDVLGALEEIEYYGNRDKIKFKKMEEAKGYLGKKNAPDIIEKSGQGIKRKSSFLAWLVFFVFLGVLLYVYFSGRIDFEWIRAINFK